MSAPTDKEARFHTIVRENRRMIYKVCYMYATDNEHFNDLYQEVLANVWQGLDRFRGDARISTWLYRTAINTCVTYYRHNNRHTEGRMSVDMLEQHPAEDNRHLEMLREMYRLISGLDKMEKALILMWLDEKSYDEIAEMSGLTRNTVATRLRRIKQKLIDRSNLDS